MSHISERLSEIMNFNNLNTRTLAKKMGVSDVMAGKYLTGISSPGFNALQNIIKSFPNINSKWLLTGEGKMLEPNMEVKKIGYFIKENHEEIMRENELYSVWFKNKINEGIIEYLTKIEKQEKV